MFFDTDVNDDRSFFFEDEVDFSPRLLNKYTLNTTYSNSEIFVELVDFIEGEK